MCNPAISGVGTDDVHYVVFLRHIDSELALAIEEFGRMSWRSYQIPWFVACIEKFNFCRYTSAKLFKVSGCVQDPPSD